MVTGTNNLTDIPQTGRLWDAIGYAVLLLIMAGQATVAVNNLAGQIIFLAANLLSIVRTFRLRRPLADKVKDVMCVGLTVTILLLSLAK